MTHVVLRTNRLGRNNSAEVRIWFPYVVTNPGNCHMAQISCLHREVALELERVAPSGKVRKGIP